MSKEAEEGYDIKALRNRRQRKSKLSDVPWVHVCLPWSEYCGNVLRLQIRINRWGFSLALHPNAKFSYHMPDGSWESYWFVSGVFTYKEWE